MSDSEDSHECQYCHEVYGNPRGENPNINQPYVQRRYLDEYLHFLDSDRKVRLFLAFDSCFIFADKYLLATIFKYILRLSLTPREFTSEVFFKLLYLALEVCEENKAANGAVYAWSQDPEKMYLRGARMQYDLEKLQLFFTMNCRALVCREWCEAIFMSAPNSPAFQRTREEGHSGVQIRLIDNAESTYYAFPHHGTCSRCIVGS